MGGLAPWVASMAGWHGWTADKGDFKDIIYQVVYELAIEKDKNLCSRLHFAL